MSYINSLNLLGTDPPNDISEETLTEELSLWATAQFTFDTEPGSALLDDLTKEAKSSAASKADHADLFATLAEFGQQHQQQPQQQSYLPATTTTTNTTATSTANSYILPQIPQHHPTPQQHHLPRIAPAPGLHMPTDPTWPMSSALTPTTPGPSTNSSSSRKRKQPPTTTDNNNNNSSGNSNNSSSTSETNDSEKLLAEEDKRRRNTAASARFRMKKKMREQALEQTAKEMTAKAEELEKRVKELEMEAKWLRALVVEKDPKLLDLVKDQPTSSPSESS